MLLLLKLMVVKQEWRPPSCFLWLEHVQLECDYSPTDEWKSPKGTDGIRFVREPLTVASERLQINDVICLNFAKG